MKSALVISGGGSKGAFAGGIAQQLKESGKDYQFYIGSSTGSLLIPLLAIDKLEKLKKTYSNICQKDIFSSNPFIIKKNKIGEFTVAINHMSVLKLFLWGRKTFGESMNLLNLIKSTFTKEDHQELISSGKSVVVTVSNLTTNIVEYKFLEKETYDDAVLWMWASANVVPFMSLVQKNGFEYADGSFGNMAPVQKAIDFGCCEVDAIILENQEKIYHNSITKNGFDLLIKVLNFSLTQIIKNDISIANLSTQNKNVKLNLFFPPRVLTYNSLIFEPKLMKEWWEEAYQYSKKEIFKEYTIKA